MILLKKETPPISDVFHVKQFYYAAEIPVSLFIWYIADQDGAVEEVGAVVGAEVGVEGSIFVASGATVL